MSWFCSTKCIIKLTFLYGIFVSAILFLPNLPPHNIEFTSYELPPTKKLTGPLALNTKLNNAEKLFEHLLKGPESFAYHNGILYTGVQGGYIIKISGNSITPFVRFGKSCDGIHEEYKCGRPLGLRIDSKENLYAADAYYGIFKVNITTGDVLQLVDTKTPIEGRTPKFINSITIASDGNIYWTDSDSDFDLQNLAYTVFSEGAGRVIKYDSNSKTNTVLIDRVHLANGIALSFDESQLYICESSRFRVLRYYLKGSKKGQFEVAVDGLPGAPDNIKSDKQGNMYVSLILPRDDEMPHIILNIGSYPLLRKFIARIMALTQDGINLLDYIVPNSLLKKAFHNLRHCEALQSVLPQHKRVTIIKLNKDGAISDSLHATDGRISGISEIEFVEDYIYLGSPCNSYLARWQEEMTRRVGLPWCRAAQNRIVWAKTGEAYTRDMRVWYES